MREYLFRGIPKDDTTRHFFADIWKDDCEGSFVYGSLIISKDRYYICVSALCQINSCINNGMTSMIEVIPETVGQYTGLTDKNGTKIFEGDIVRQDYSKTVNVMYDPDTLGFIDSEGIDGHHIGVVKITASCGACMRNPMSYDVVEDNDRKVNGYVNVRGYRCEIIGNIHDNPELLKGGVQE